MKALPVFYYPTTWLWIDDDSLLLSSIPHIFTEHDHIKLFQSPKECLSFLHSYQPFLTKKSFLKSIMNDENYGVLQHTPIDFDITMLANIANDPSRHNEITTMIIDYNMPEMDGFSLAQACQSFPIKKILLTGKAKKEEAIIGFNKNLIHRFVQKGVTNLEHELIMQLKELSYQYFQEITTPLLSCLETENPLPLSDPIFIAFFKAYCKKYNVTEYYLIDKQGSFLCINNKREKFYFVIQTDHNIEAWLTIYGTEKELSDDQKTLLQERKKIPFFGGGKEAWQVNPLNWPEHFYTPDILEGRVRYFWTILYL